MLEHYGPMVVFGRVNQDSGTNRSVDTRMKIMVGEEKRSAWSAVRTRVLTSYDLDAMSIRTPSSVVHEQKMENNDERLRLLDIRSNGADHL
jgi:hypothetical protein